MVTELKNGVFVDRDKFLEDLSKAHREGLFNNVTFTLSDGVEISTNKFMLACRSPFFATMLFCELKEGSSDKIELKCCDSKIMGKVLDFIWEGKADLSEMDVQSLLDILETSRMMCLDSLNKGVEHYLEDLINSKKVEFEDCLAALDFAIAHKFENLSESLLHYIDQNLESVRTLLRFGSISEGSVWAMLNYGGRTSKEIDLFQAFATWIEDKKDLQENMKTQMISFFDLKRFTRTEILKTVRKTNFFEDQDIFDVLEVKVDEIEEQVSSQQKKLESQKQQLMTKDLQLNSKLSQLN